MVRERKPVFGFSATTVRDPPVAVREVAVLRRPFCTLLHFERDTPREDPQILLVAPLSGHSPVLLRDMVAALLPEHDVYITDWADAREVPVADGAFGLEDNIGYVLEFVRRLGPDVHLVGLCQSSVPALAATSLLAAAAETTQPRSLTLIAGSIDPRICPTRCERVLAETPLAWFERTAIVPVPAGYPGARRPVHPRGLRLASLMNYLARHMRARDELFRKLVSDDGEDVARYPFAMLYLAVMDLPAEFFLETVKTVFQDRSLPEGRMMWHGRRIEPAAIARTALMTVEGEDDDVSAPGQTKAAHALCRNIPCGRRRHHVQLGAGHFGTFHGQPWRSRVFPLVRDFVRDAG